MQCRYVGHDTGGERCKREAVKGWTTCARHYTAGHSTKQDRKS